MQPQPHDVLARVEDHRDLSGRVPAAAEQTMWARCATRPIARRRSRS